MIHLFFSCYRCADGKVHAYSWLKINVECSLKMDQREGNRTRIIRGQ